MLTLLAGTVTLKFTTLDDILAARTTPQKITTGADDKKK